MIFEDLCKDALIKESVLFEDKTQSFATDFLCKYHGKSFALEVKEKKNPYNKVWSELSGIPLQNVFIIDELSIKSLFRHYPFAFVLIKDNLRLERKYVVFNLFDFLSIPKVRVNRPIERKTLAKKGKWIIDLTLGGRYEELEHALWYILAYVDTHVEKVMGFVDCYDINGVPTYTMEEGYTRLPQHWKKDLVEKSYFENYYLSQQAGVK
jgi:hypothetical protein